MSDVTIYVPTGTSVETFSNPLWRANFEGTNLSEMYSPCAYSGINNPPIGFCDSVGGAGGGVFNSGTASASISSDRAHSGSQSAKLSIDNISSASSGTRLFRWRETQQHVETYTSAWYFFPVAYSTGGTDYAAFLNLMQWKSTNANKNDPFFILGIVPGLTTTMKLRATWWSGFPAGFEGPQAGQFGGRTWNAPIDCPVGQWVHIETRIVSAGDFTGAVQIWQNGVEIFHLENCKTRYPDGDLQWSVNCYGLRVASSPVVIYVDDMAISTSRVYK